MLTNICSLPPIISCDLSEMFFEISCSNVVSCLESSSSVELANCCFVLACHHSKQLHPVWLTTTSETFGSHCNVTDLLKFMISVREGQRSELK